MNLENRAWGLKTLPHSGPGAFNGSFLSPLSPVSGEFPFSLGRYLLDSEFVPTAATHEILIVFLPVLLPAGGRKVGFPTRAGEGQTLGLGGLPGFAYATVSQD